MKNIDALYKIMNYSYIIILCYNFVFLFKKNMVELKHLQWNTYISCLIF